MIRDLDDLLRRMRVLAVDHEPDGWPAVQMRDITALCDEVERLHDERVAALALVADVRFACGDYGQRMQPELLEYLRGLAADAARYRWLRRKFGIVAAVDGAQFCALNMPRPAYIAPDAAAELDAAIDAAKGGA